MCYVLCVYWKYVRACARSSSVRQQNKIKQKIKMFTHNVSNSIPNSIWLIAIYQPISLTHIEIYWFQILINLVISKRLWLFLAVKTLLELETGLLLALSLSWNLIESINFIEVKSNYCTQWDLNSSTWQWSSSLSPQNVISIMKSFAEHSFVFLGRRKEGSPVVRLNWPITMTTIITMWRRVIFFL